MHIFLNILAINQCCIAFVLLFLFGIIKHCSLPYLLLHTMHNILHIIDVVHYIYGFQTKILIRA